MTTKTLLAIITSLGMIIALGTTSTVTAQISEPFTVDPLLLELKERADKVHDRIERLQEKLDVEQAKEILMKTKLTN